MKLWIIKKDGVEQKEIDDITVEEVGQKTIGLCRVPCAWTLPFFAITRDLFTEICNDKEQNGKYIIKRYMENIMFAVESLKLGANLIIRSSGAKEGMDERGKYDSIDANILNLEFKILELVHRLACEVELLEDGMPLIIQAYLSDCIIGHISNERRFSKENRDFVYEYRYPNLNRVLTDNHHDNERIETGNISLRNWRKKYNAEDYINLSLDFTSDFVERLKIVCAYYYYHKQRVHIEFVCSENTLYIVQCDLEVEGRGAVNPEEYDIKMFEKEDIFQPLILRKISDEDKGKYRKIDNVFVYKEVGIPMPPLYILDDKKCLEDLKVGTVSEYLKADLEFMTKQSLVIRTNVISDEKLMSQFSKRSNELRNRESAIDFLVKASTEISKEGIEDYIFILHNFVPAKIAAFVNAKPLQRVVEIQALWGLPEGLYYNAHDRISVDTKDINTTKMDRNKFNISKNEVYKECFIAPDKEGKWVVKRLKHQYNWRCTISDDEVIKDIAEKARKITEKVGIELSIMWFVGIDEAFYNTNNIPWYHENYDRNSYYYTNNSNIQLNYKKKYFYEKEVLVETLDDLEKLKVLNSKEIGLVRIRPKEDDILRSKEFIKEFGTLCKERNANIFLEGAILAHSFYQLVNTGATVIVAHEMKHYKDKIEFNKLVRDNIPKIIEKNGENVTCIMMEGVGLIRQLKNKIIEESYEVLAANSKEELVEELADLEEVCIALENNVEFVVLDKFTVRQQRRHAIKLEFEGAVFEESKQSISKKIISNTESIELYATMERQNNNVQVDLFFGHNSNSSSDLSPIFYDDDDKKRILSLAFQIFSTNAIDECKKLLYEIRVARQRILQFVSCTQEEFEAVRIHKKTKKGGLEKGYVLLETDLVEDNPEETLFSPMLNVKDFPCISYELPVNTRIDVEILNELLLLVRLTFPLYIKKEEWSIRRKIINDFFDGNVSIYLTKKFVDSKIFFYLELEKENHKQLILEFV